MIRSGVMVFEIRHHTHSDVSLSHHVTESLLGLRNLLLLQIELVEQPFDREKNIKKGFCFITFETGDPVDVICVNQKHHVGGRDVSTPLSLIHI